MHGRLRQRPAEPDQHDLVDERYRWREARRAVGIAQAHALRPRIQSVRALARELGVNRITVLRWLQLPPPHPTSLTELVEAAGILPPVDPPPAPWRDWDQIRRVREDLRLRRTLFLHRPEHLGDDEQRILADLLASPVGDTLRVARGFLEAWFAIWQDEDGHRRSPIEAEQRYHVWHEDAAAAEFAPLRKQLQHLDADHFARLSVFLHDPTWEPPTMRPNVVDGPFGMPSIRISVSENSR